MTGVFPALLFVSKTSLDCRTNCQNQWRKIFTCRQNKMAGAKVTVCCCHSDQMVYTLEPMLLRKTLCCHINKVDKILKTKVLSSKVCSKMTYASQNVMPFVSELRATGHGEVWDHTDEKKFQQFGWRCTNTESSYNTSTLIGNWNEQRFDINRISKPKPLPSQVRKI